MGTTYRLFNCCLGCLGFLGCLVCLVNERILCKYVFYKKITYVLALSQEGLTRAKIGEGVRGSRGHHKVSG